MDTNKVVVLAGSGSASAQLTTILQWVLESTLGSNMPEQVALAFAGLLVPTLYAVLVKVQKYLVGDAVA